MSTRGGPVPGGGVASSGRGIGRGGRPGRRRDRGVAHGTIAPARAADPPHRGGRADRRRAARAGAHRVGDRGCRPSPGRSVRPSNRTDRADHVLHIGRSRRSTGCAGVGAGDCWRCFIAADPAPFRTDGSAYGSVWHNHPAGRQRMDRAERGAMARARDAANHSLALRNATIYGCYAATVRAVQIGLFILLDESTLPLTGPLCLLRFPHSHGSPGF